MAAAVLAVAPPAARADDAPRALRLDFPLDAVFTAAEWAAWGGAELAEKQLAPSACRVCGTNALDASARDLLLWRHPDRARLGSDAILALIPVGVAAHQLLAARAAGDVHAGVVDLLFVAEAVGLALDLDQLTKLVVGRQRPFVHYGAQEPARAPQPDDNLSFFSGHATLAFSLAASAATVSSLRGYRNTRWVWAVGMSLAAAVAYLRVAGDQHYLTDVLAGAAVGTAVGIGVPALFPGRDTAASGPRAALAFPLGVRVTF